jgi:hypothetical protein
MLIVSLVAAGCSRSNSGAPAVIEPAKVPATVNNAFNQASGQTRQIEASYVSAFQKQDPVAAFVQLQKLNAQHDLNSQQRTVVERAWVTTMQQLRAAADNGNQSAQTLLHQYISTR